MIMMQEMWDRRDDGGVCEVLFVDGVQRLTSAVRRVEKRRRRGRKKITTMYITNMRCARG